ncbi:MAG: class I SAM-dependent methyltransferase [Parvularculaceae bacterium]
MHAAPVDVKSGYGLLRRSYRARPCFIRLLDAGDFQGTGPDRPRGVGNRAGNRVRPGRNAPFYDECAVTRLFALEPSQAMRRRAAKRIADLAFPIEWLDLKAEEIPLDSKSVDTVLVTYTLCTIPDVARALLARDGY